MEKPAKIFISYSHKDSEYVELLQTHLSLLKREGIIEAWHDREISIGETWDKEIDNALNTADIVLLLISADFLASDYCYDVEVKQALAMHNAGEAVVIPIIVRPCDWQAAPFSRLQALPRDGKPISSFSNLDEAFLQTAKEIRKIAKTVEPSEGLPVLSSIELRLDKNFDDFSEDDQAKFLDSLKNILSLGGDVKVINKRRGSVVLKLKLSREEIERLQMAARTGELDDLSIIDAEVVSDETPSMDFGDQRPKVFIGSSSEGLPVAETIQLGLDHLCEVSVWHQGVFSPSAGTLEALLEASREYDFAILVLTPDDFIESRGDLTTSPRDNVIFELGLFIGLLGRERTMIVYDRTSEIKIPSDLSGITMITYQPHSSGDLESTLGAPCTRLKQHIQKYGLKNT